MGPTLNNVLKFTDLPRMVASRWGDSLEIKIDQERQLIQITCDPEVLQDLCQWLFYRQGYSLATLIAEEAPPEWVMRYILYGDTGNGQVHVLTRFPLSRTKVPSISPAIHAADWQEREIEDLFGLSFEGHPKLGDFILHEDWPEGASPMRTAFDASRLHPRQESGPPWRPEMIVKTPGAFMMPVGPVYSDTAESAHFLLETVGEDVVRTIPKFFYKYRGVEKIAEGMPADHALLLAERFSGSSAFAHSLAFCQALEAICKIQAPPRARALRVLLAEMERLRHHTAAVAGICSSTALAVAASQTSIIEEDLLRLTCRLAGHRYFFGLNTPGGLARDLPDGECKKASEAAWIVLDKLKELHEMLRFTSSFLDRLEEVGSVSRKKAVAYGLVGPVARASGVSRDLRVAQPYAGYGQQTKFQVPREAEGDGYARLRVLFAEAEQSVNLIHQVASTLPAGPVRTAAAPTEGCALGWAEAPRGAAFHWLRTDGSGNIRRYRVMPPSFVNWHGFHLAAEEFAFQDFPIIMATFGLSNAECDR